AEDGRPCACEAGRAARRGRRRALPRRAGAGKLISSPFLCHAISEP
uniref:Uncharacterized protein n=1 Tax=Aegilops tauschii subsp. strangulata TaxID=200361 RepID=A0A453J1J5_AEGTS